MIARQSRSAPVESLSARVLRYRIGRGYSPGDLAIRRLESGRAVDKRMLAPVAAALGVPLCRLVCGEHNCAQRACVPSSRREPAPELPRRRGRTLMPWLIRRQAQDDMVLRMTWCSG